MVYLSKGLLLKDNEDCGEVFAQGGAVKVTGTELRYWKMGHAGFAVTESPEEEQIIMEMERSGLVETADPDDYGACTELLLRCIPLPNKKASPAHVISFAEVIVYHWIVKAGVHLTIAEIAYLLMHNIPPTPDVLGDKNIQKLVSLLYLYCDPIEKKRSIESVVAGSKACDETQKIIFSLLQQNFIYLL